MQLQTQNLTSISRGIEGQWNYQVANSPKVMAMLGDMLYKDKIMAPIRELTANAIDAHIEAGTIDKAIHFSLPSAYDTTPIFKIRDYGCGMPEDKMVKLYRIYGLSDKDGDNSKTGCLGLGSKSPFSYCDSFTSISYYNGKKYVYVNAKLPNGVPSLQKMGEYTTDEENGFEVSFVIKNTDVQLFKEKLEKVLKRCPIPYTCNKVLNVKKDNNKKILLEGDNWKVYQQDTNDRHSAYYTKAVAIMGHIEYPIAAEHFFGTNKELLHLPIELSFNIGEIEMDISREGLQYNDYTKAAINKKLDEINAALVDMMQEKINTADNMYDARNICIDLCKTFSYLPISNNNTTFKWNKQDIDNNYVSLTDKIRYDADFVDAIYTFKSYGTKYKYRHQSNFYNIKFNDSLIIVVNDLANKTAKARTVAYINKVNNENINNDDHVDITQALIIEKSSEQKLIDIIGIPQDRLIYASKLDKPPKRISNNTTKNSGTVLKYVKTSDIIQDYGVIVTHDIKINKTVRNKYYVVVNRNDYQVPGNRTMSGFTSMIRLADKNNIHLPTEIYFVQPSKKDNVKKYGWTSIVDYLLDECDKLVKSANKKKLSLALKSININNTLSYLVHNIHHTQILNNKLFKKYQRLVKFVKKNHEDALNILNFCNILLYDTSTAFNKTNTLDIYTVESKIYNKYPMFRVFDGLYYKSDHTKYMVDYINFIDSLN